MSRHVHALASLAIATLLSADGARAEPAHLTASPALSCQPESARSEPALAISVGIAGTSSNDRGVDGGSTGAFAEVEYVHWGDRWFSPRAYAGLLLTSPDGDCRSSGPCDVSARIGFVGGKMRLMAPIPYVGPFLELGAGASFGRLVTRSGATDRAFTGVTYHVPIGVGLALGSRHQYVVAVQYMDHPEQRLSTGGALTLGFTFPL